MSTIHTARAPAGTLQHSLFPRCCFPPRWALHLQAPGSAPPSPPHPSAPLPFTLRSPPILLPRLWPNASAFLSFPKAEGSAYPNTRSPVGLGAPDSASFDQGGFRAPALRLPEPRSPGSLGCHGTHAAGEAGGGGGATQTVSVSQLQAGRTSSGSSRLAAVLVSLDSLS